MNHSTSAGGCAHTDSRQSLPRVFTLVILFIFIAILGAGIFVPLYGDETATMLMRGMFIANGWKLNTLVPQCQLEFLRPVPRTLLPGALAYGLAYLHGTPLGIRIAGMSIDGCVIGLTYATLKSTAAAPRLRSQWFIAVLCFAGLGVLPLTLVMARGEQILLLLVLVFLCAPEMIRRFTRGTHLGRIVAIAIVFCLLESIFLYTHPKALFFCPVLFVSAWSSFWPRSRIVCACVFGFTLFALRDTLHFAYALTECPGAPIFSTGMQSMTTAPGLLFSQPLGFIAQVWNNVHTAPDSMLAHIKFADAYQSGWLAASPGLAGTWLTGPLNGGIEAAVKVVFWCAAFLPPFAFIFGLARRRQLSVVGGLIIALWISIAGHVALYKVWNFYSATLVLPLMMTLLALSAIELASLDVLDLPPRIVGIPLTALALLFVISAGTLLWKVMPPTIQASLAPGFSMPGQPISVPTIGYGRRRTGIREFASKCGVKGDGAKRLVIDNMTFFAFDGLRQPLQSDYVSDKGFGMDYRGDAQLSLLRRVGANAIVAQCTLLSDTVLRSAIQQDGLCCLDLNNAK